MIVDHSSLPIFINPSSKILILGSFPSIKSRELGFYYSHKQNRFFSVLSVIFNEDEPLSIKDRKDFLKRHLIALYDVIERCEIVNSSDSSIKNVVPIDIRKILSDYPNIKKIGVTGKKASSLFEKYLRQYVREDIEVYYLPSTSPANAKMSIEELVNEYKILFAE